MRVSVDPPDLRRRGEHHRHAQRLRGRARGRRAQGGVRRLGRHALRGARTDPGTRGPPAAAARRRTACRRRPSSDYLHYYREVRGLEYTALALANVYGPRQDPHGEAGVSPIFAGLLLDARTTRRSTATASRRATSSTSTTWSTPSCVPRRRAAGSPINIGTGVETSRAVSCSTRWPALPGSRIPRATHLSGWGSCGDPRSTRVGPASTSDGSPGPGSTTGCGARSSGSGGSRATGGRLRARTASGRSVRPAAVLKHAEALGLFEALVLRTPHGGGPSALPSHVPGVSYQSRRGGHNVIDHPKSDLVPSFPDALSRRRRRCDRARPDRCFRRLGFRAAVGDPRRCVRRRRGRSPG